MRLLFIMLWARIQTVIWMFKFLPVALQAGREAGECGYDHGTRKQRAQEAISLAALNGMCRRIESLKEYTQYTEFFLVFATREILAGLVAAGWSLERAKKKVTDSVGSD